MPIVTKCPKCGFEGNHGFGHCNGGMWFYHDNPFHRFYRGNDDRYYETELELFKAITMPEAKRSNDPGKDDWIKARLFDLTGHPRKAKRHYDAWKQANDCL